MLDWFLPSLYGDVKLTRKTEETTILTLSRLSPTEKDAVKELLRHATTGKVLSKAWASEEAVGAIDLDKIGEQSVELMAPISKVAKFLAGKLKPYRKQVSAVRFSNGRFEEVTEANLKVIDTPEEAAPESEKTPKPVVATTVARPVLGCPAPDFDEADVRATRVLSRFLSPEQRDDFRKTGQFLAIGADTGHRYILTSRHSRSRLAVFTRTLYDADAGIALCVHDWDVPAAEELLGLLVHLSLPGLETYVRSIPDNHGVLRRPPDLFS